MDNFKRKNKLNFTIVAISSILVLIISTYSHSADTIQYFDNGKINWSQGRIYAWGTAKVDNNIKPFRLAQSLAKEKSVILAKKNLIEIIKKVKLDSKVSVEDLNKSIRYVGAKINNVVKLAEKRTYLVSEETAKTTLVIQIYGKLSSFLLPHIKAEAEIENPDKLLIEKLRRRNLSNQFLSATATPIKTVKGEYSGLVIDARHLHLVPVLFPKIINERGKEIYGISKFSANDVKKGNIVVYTNDLKSALANPRIGPHPLVIRAIEGRKGSNEIVIPNRDSRKIEFENKKNNFLEEGRVAIILN
ncbi:MAG: hypothetical protein D6734_02725 [Candidatus Schekmanbacteria bacterium]|nr:MAG: hypothetical protein D6734_02725 [Candidatus Schekmanbacteria bacterium]